MVKQGNFAVVIDIEVGKPKPEVNGKSKFNEAPVDYKVFKVYGAVIEIEVANAIGFLSPHVGIGMSFRVYLVIPCPELIPAFVKNARIYSLYINR
jgi:hypothetical protein